MNLYHVLFGATSSRHMTFAHQTAIFMNAVDGFVNGKTN